MQDPMDDKISRQEFLLSYSQKKKEGENAEISKIKDLNNQMLSDFADLVFTSDEKLFRSEVAQKWRIYEDGIEVRRYMQNKKRIILPSEVAQRKAREFFDRDIEDIYESGYPLTVQNFSILDCEKTRRIMGQKYKRVFSSEDPRDWFEKAREFREPVSQEDIQRDCKFKALSLAKLYI
ncbi:hypothetical protein MAR_ORF116 [Marseillevirus marseillevirus]|uniref:Uncharacterized protein n=1 Tax=Marseillevirus marseillevirus TaxID=694581 RepID=D2XAC4_GBMV|nr:hypothetical protein MAR_ORF116 [Marseillevirus marseillevirus]ADB03901.1 hypothetical protein MAR_ORF116 [Marseillevirus marseillevirus]